jgi:hypothetical protein
LKFRSRPNITIITLRVIYSCRGVFLTPLPRHQVLKRGRVSAYPIHAFALDPPSRSPKHFARIILVRRPALSSTSKIFVLEIQLSSQSHLSHRSHPFFFQSLVLFVSSRFMLPHQESRSNPRKSQVFFPILALLWNPGKDWLVQRRDAVAKKGDRGVEGKKGCRARHGRVKTASPPREEAVEPHGW